MHEPSEVQHHPAIALGACPKRIALECLHAQGAQFKVAATIWDVHSVQSALQLDLETLAISQTLYQAVQSSLQLLRQRSQSVQVVS